MLDRGAPYEKYRSESPPNGYAKKAWVPKSPSWDTVAGSSENIRPAVAFCGVLSFFCYGIGMALCRPFLVFKEH